MDEEDELPYASIPDPPGRVGGATVMVRLIDGLAFRYRWATEGLRAADADFRPGEGSMTLRELLVHIARLVSWTDGHLGGKSSTSFEPELQALRRQTLTHLGQMRERLLTMNDGTLAQHHITSKLGDSQPFWNMLNGPLADALTHVGQVNAWRRLAGNPAPRVDVFRGRPPASS